MVLSGLLEGSCLYSLLPLDGSRDELAIMDEINASALIATKEIWIPSTKIEVVNKSKQPNNGIDQLRMASRDSSVDSISKVKGSHVTTRRERSHPADIAREMGRPTKLAVNRPTRRPKRQP